MKILNPTLLIVCLVFLVGLGLSSFSGLVLYQSEHKAILGEFQNEVDAQAARLHREVLINFEALQSLAIIFEEKEVPTLTRFRHVAKNILERRRDVQALEWVPRIPQAERDQFESRMQTYYPDFRITERQQQGVMQLAQRRDLYFPVYYLEPWKGNETALGFDLASNPSRLKTLKESMLMASPRASAGITLVQENSKQAGFLAFLPIYKGLPTTAKAREHNLKGFVLGVYRIGDIFGSSIHSNGAPGIKFDLIDDTSAIAPRLLLSHSHSVEDGLYEGIHYQTALPMLWGRQWSLRATPAQSYIELRRGFLPQVTFAAGMVATVLLSLYLYVILNRSSAIKQQVIEKTKALNEANKKLQLISREDSLTGLANRRCLDETLKQEWRRAIRNKTPLTLLLIDVDYFKRYNDRYGHPKGDLCLQQIALQLAAKFQRSSDLAARYGGEEFAVIMPDTHFTETLAEDCCQSIESLQIEHEESEVAEIVTISIGLCTCHPKVGTLESSILETADKMLYEAKQAGRNCFKGIEIP